MNTRNVVRDNAKFVTAAKDASISWDAITLPFNDVITITEDNSVLVDDMYYTRGFSFTLSAPAMVGLVCPNSEYYFTFYSDSTMTGSIASGSSVYVELQAGEHYFTVDDNAGILYGGLDSLSAITQAFEMPGSYQTYQQISYTNVLNETTPASGIITDTLLFNPSSRQVFYFSTYNPYKLSVVEGESYFLTAEFSNTRGEMFAAGMLLLKSTFAGATSDIITSNFNGDASSFTVKLVFTAEETGDVYLLPVSFMSNVNYVITLEHLNTMTVPELLNAATVITEAQCPFFESGDFSLLPLVDSEDGSMIGHPYLPGALYHAAAFKIHVDANANVEAKFLHSYSEPVSGVIYLFEKDGNDYIKVDEVWGVELEDTAKISYDAIVETDLWIVGGLYPTLYFPNDEGEYKMFINYNSVGINDVAKDDVFSIMPNPATNQINIIAKNYNEVKVYDIFGRELIGTGKQTSIDISNLANGIYNVRLLSNGKTVGSKKIVKQ
ncbi:MAG: T9SS type A sorting domain-containing protein [Bacteroidales bacterium]|jgi:hypothetical protein|nr:T9SS type A sorting domain-containing protein [Bacteroidales bacterium]